MEHRRGSARCDERGLCKFAWAFPAVIFGALVSGVSAQQDRYQRIVRSPLHEAPDSPLINWSAGDLGIQLPNGKSQSLAVGIANPGGYDALLDESEIYLAGRGVNGTGRLVALRFDGQQYQVAWAHDEPDGDYLGVAYSTATGRIYVLDGVDREVRCASYAPRGSAPADWSTVANEDHVPALAGDHWLGDYGLHLLEDGSEPTIQIASVGRRVLETHTLRHTQSGLRVSTYRSPLVDAARIEHIPAPGATSVPAVARAGVAVTLHRMDEAGWPRIASGTAGSSGDVVLAYPPGLQWGGIYGVKDSQQTRPAGPFRTPQLTIGAPDPFPGHVVLPFDNLGMQMWPGHSWFAVPLVLSANGSPTGVPVAHDAMLNVGILGASQVYTLPDGRQVLDPLASASTQITLGGVRPSTRVDLPLDDDPNLVGIVVLFQWVIVADAAAGDFRLSEIAGPIIRSQQWIPPGAEALFEGDDDQSLRQTGASAAPLSPRSGEREVDALREHLRSLGFGAPVVPEFRQFLQRARK